MNVLKVMSRYIRIKWETMKQYKMELVNQFLLLSVNLGIMPFIWYLVTNHGSKAFNGWAFPHFVLLNLVSGFMYSLVGFLGVFDIYEKLASEEGRRQLAVLFYRPFPLGVSLVGEFLYMGDAIASFIYLCAIIGLSYVLHLHITLTFIVAFIFGAAFLLTMLGMIPPIYLLFERGGNLFASLMWTVNKTGEFPLTEVRGVWALLFFFILPIGFVMAVPVAALKGEIQASFLVKEAVVLAIFLFIAKELWGYALRKYEAVGE